jgi:chloramphenicol 3-O-phosphotransferase
MADRSAIIVITGIQGAGKSTVGRLLAARFARGAFVEADALQRMIVSGGQWVTESAAPVPLTNEAGVLLRLRLGNSCLVARSFFGVGFTVVLDDIIIGERWDHIREDLRGQPFYFVVLAPNVETVIARDAAREKAVGAEWAFLDGDLRRTMAGVGLWVDSSGQSPEETVNEIVQRLDEGLIES